MTIKSGTTLLLRLGLLALCLAVPQLARAQEPAKPADPPDPDKVTLNFFRNTEIGGLVDAYWLYNSNKVPPLYQSFDVLYNSFDISMSSARSTRSSTIATRSSTRRSISSSPTSRRRRERYAT